MMNGKRVQWHFCELILGFSTSPESALKPPGSKTEKMLLHRITSILYFFFSLSVHIQISYCFELGFQQFELQKGLA